MAVLHAPEKFTKDAFCPNLGKMIMATKIATRRRPLTGVNESIIRTLPTVLSEENRSAMKLISTRFARLLWILGLATLVLSGSRGWATENAVVEARILDDLKYLAGDVCEGRGTNTKGIHLAADYIANEFKKAGLKPAAQDGSYFQPFKITSKIKTVDEECGLTLQGPQGQQITLELGKQFNVLGFSGSGKIAAPVVFVGYGITSKDPAYDDFAGIDVAGKIVVVLRQLPQNGAPDASPFIKQAAANVHPHAALQAKASNAEVHKAAAVVFVNDNLTAAEANDSLRDFRMTQSMDAVGIPVIHARRSFINMMVRGVTGEDLSVIEKAIDRDLKPHSFALDGWSGDVRTKVEREAVTVKNVIGVIDGSGPLADETVVIGAHYDHLGYGEPGSLARGSKAIHYGADDNCSGTVSIIELARRLGALQGQKGRRLVLMTFAGEERGLLGSRHYCRNPLFPLEKTVAMINLDMVGRLRDDKLQILGIGTGGGFNELLDKLNDKYKFELAKSKGVSLMFGGSDHQSFYDKNIPVLFFFTGLHEQYHRPTDTVDTINVAGIRRIVEMTEEIANYVRTVEKRPEFSRPATPASTGGGPRMAGPRLGIMPSYADEKEGVLLEGVTSDGVAGKAGLKADDRIVEIDGKPVKNVTGYMTIMGNYKKGDKIEVTVRRKDETKKVSITLE